MRANWKEYGKEDALQYLGCPSSRTAERWKRTHRPRTAYPAMAKVIIGGAAALETSFLAGEPREQTELFVPATSDALSWKENGVYLSYQRQKPRNLSAGGTGFAIHCRSR